MLVVKNIEKDKAEKERTQSGVLIYKSFSDRLVTVVQPGDTNFMGRTAFTRSNFDHLPLF